VGHPPPGGKSKKKRQGGNRIKPTSEAKNAFFRKKWGRGGVIGNLLSRVKKNSAIEGRYTEMKTRGKGGKGRLQLSVRDRGPCSLDDAVIEIAEALWGRGRETSLV